MSAHKFHKVVGPWKCLGSTVIYTNPWISVREDQVITPGGVPGIYGVVESRVATGVVALTDDLQVYLVGQHRYPVDEYSWEIPEGGADPDEAPMDAARRELREETGLIASQWEPLGGEVHLSNCFSAERGYLFLARGLQEGPSEPDHTEALEVRVVPFVDALAMVERGEVKDSLTIIALYRAARLLAVRGL